MIIHKKAPMFALSVLVAVMAGCTSLPKAPVQVLAQPNINLEKSYEIAETDRETVSVSTMPSVAATGWQDFYADPKLKALIELGLANNKSMEQAIIAIQKSRAAYRIARTDSVPTVNGSFGYDVSANHAIDRNASDGYSVGLATSNYEIDLWGRVASLKESALQNYLATTAAKDSVQISLIADIAQSYVAISYAKAQLMLAESTVASRERSLYVTQRRFEAGIDSRSPSLQAEASLELARVAVLNARTSLLKAQNAMELLIGGGIPSELMPEAGVTGIVSPTVFNAGLPSDLLYYRPDIASAEYALKAAGADINAARAAFFPSITLMGSLGYGSSELNDLFDIGGMSWKFGPSISIPIFNADKLNANYEVAQLNQREALAKYEQAIQSAFREVKDVLASRSALNSQLESQYKLQENYQRTYDISYATFRAGLSSYLEALDAERSLFANQQSILEYEQQRVVNQIELYKVLGGGANLTAPQIVGEQKQATAMTSAKIATNEEIEALQPIFGSPAVYESSETKAITETSDKSDVVE